MTPPNADRSPSARNRTPGPILEAVGLVRSFVLGPRRVDVLTDASVALAEREFIGIVGLSGVGKSTLLHLLGALDTPDGGELRFRGEDVFGYSERERARFRNERVGFVFQFHHLLPEFTALENVMIPARIGGASEGRARRAAVAILERVGLAARLGHRPAELSGGEQQRVAVARALINEPDILLADEPSGNLDPETGRMIYDLLLDLRDSLGKSIVVTTHSADLAARCDRVLELSHGRLGPLRTRQNRPLERTS